jgi:5'-3' exonuclease
MTHEPEKNVFRDAQLQIKTIGIAQNDIFQVLKNLDTSCANDIASQLDVISAALHTLDMSVREIVDKLTHYGKLHIIANETLIRQTQELDSPHDGIQAIQDKLKLDILSAKSFSEGTARAVMEQEQADAEKRYYSDRAKRVDAACDDDNTKDEEFRGPDGGGEK